MTVAITPTYPTPDTSVTLSASGSSANVHAWELTAKPSQSDLQLGLLTKTGVRAGATSQGIVDDGLETATWEPDASGEYTFTRRGYLRQISIPSFGGDADETRNVLVDTESAVVHVGAIRRLPLETVHGSIVLSLQVNDETIRAAELLEPSSEVARIAGLDTTVQTKLSALVGVTVANLTDSLQSIANTLRTKFEAHRILTSGGTIHRIADNASATNLYSANSDDAAIPLVHQLRTRLTGHLVAGVAAAGAGTNWHEVDDTFGELVSAQGSTKTRALVTAIELAYRLYEPHRSRVGSAPNRIHIGADTANGMPAIKPLPDLVVAYLNAVLAATSSAPAGEGEGAADLGALGFLS